ncbi:MAG TPA: methyltransferase domain-containing protein [Candidatus Binataceae bacterium]|nr:methyltransferase domain-containing protein [Candidatus Binataceae bacterium]
MNDWDPDLYHRFRGYRDEPFKEILARLEAGDTLAQAAERVRIVDLGCGTGENTAELARRYPGAATLGIDSSPAMIDRALKTREEVEPALRARLDFALGDIRQFNAQEEHPREYSMIFSNAALQWTTEHREIFTRCFLALAPGGRLIVQVPANDQETAQVTLSAMASEEPWREALAGVRPPSATVAAPEDYRRMLAEIGFTGIDCYYRTYHHPMGSPAEIVEWCRATVLRRYVDRLEATEREPFVEALTARLEKAYGTGGPLIFNFRRLFIWARRPPDPRADSPAKFSAN